MYVFPNVKVFEGKARGQDAYKLSFSVNVFSGKDYRLMNSLLDALADNSHFIYASEFEISKIIEAAGWKKEDINVNRMLLLSLTLFVLRNFLFILSIQNSKTCEEIAKKIEKDIISKVKELYVIAEDIRTGPFSVPVAVGISVLKEAYKIAKNGKKIVECVFSVIYPYCHEEVVVKDGRYLLKGKTVNFSVALSEKNEDSHKKKVEISLKEGIIFYSLE